MEVVLLLYFKICELALELRRPDVQARRRLSIAILLRQASMVDAEAGDYRSQLHHQVLLPLLRAR
jgi:hypothetical protein